MNKNTLTCAILHNDEHLARRLKEYIGRMPCCSLTAVHCNPLDALDDYLRNKVNLYFVELDAASASDGIGGMEFCRLLSAETRVVFIAQDGQYAAQCFQLDALDYLTDLNISTFFHTMNKVVRWFSRSADVPSRLAFISCPDIRRECIIHVRSENRILRIRLGDILYVEGMGDYAKIYTQGTDKPVLTLCSMKLMETRLPEEMFLRIHHSFIINMECVDSIGHAGILLAGKNLPVGDAYRERLRVWVSGLTIF